MTNPIRSNSQRVPAQQAGNNEQAGNDEHAGQGAVAQQRADIARQGPVAQQRANQPPGNIQNMDRLEKKKDIKNYLVEKAKEMLKIFSEELPGVSNVGDNRLDGIEELIDSGQQAAMRIYGLNVAIELADTHLGDTHLETDIDHLQFAITRCEEDETLGAPLQQAGMLDFDV